MVGVEWFCFFFFLSSLVFSLFRCRVCTLVYLEKRLISPFFSLIAWERMPSQRLLSPLYLVCTFQDDWLQTGSLFVIFVSSSPIRDFEGFSFGKLRGSVAKKPFLACSLQSIIRHTSVELRGVFPTLFDFIFRFFYVLSLLSVSNEVYIWVSR